MPSTFKLVFSTWCMILRLGHAKNILRLIGEFFQALPITREIMLRKSIRQEFDNMNDRYGQVEDWNTEYVEDMSYIFSWKVITIPQHVEDVLTHFQVHPNTESEPVDPVQSQNPFNRDLSKWNVENVKSMKSMFDNATKFNHPLTHWNTKSLKNTAYMFRNCHVFHQPLAHFNMNKVVKAEYMLYNCRTFNFPLKTWSMERVENFAGMFYRCYAFNQNVNPWRVSNGKDFSKTFSRCVSLNQSFDQWDVSNALFVDEMFSFTYKLEHSFETWDHLGIYCHFNLFTISKMFYKSKATPAWYQPIQQNNTEDLHQENSFDHDDEW